MQEIAIIAVGLLAIGVLWLSQAACRELLSSEGAKITASRTLLLLFAWSFVLGAVMRWARLAT